MKLISLISLSALLLGTSVLTAQTKPCGTDIHRQKLHKLYPENISLEESMEKNIASMPQVENRAAIYTIPVVFHVIHTNGEENISREQILDQMRVLNQDFNLLNPNLSKLRSVFKGLEADCQIKFELATIDPSGKCFDGINRVYSPVHNVHDMDNEQAKKLIYWDYKKYLNVWVVTNIIEPSSAGVILGYAVFPFNMNPNGDGIVIRHDRVGTIGTAVASDSGRTLTHEVGHWLGLFHTFQGGCANQDLVDDTPPVESTFTNANCPANGNSCNESNDKIDMWENYMDYSNGSCQCLFTLKQKARMHNFLKQAPRSSNVSSANLLATGVSPQSVAPVADFVASSTTICAGQSIKFYDISCKSDPTAWSWTFQGASQTSSSVQNPTIIYQTPGNYKVSLTVQNSRGSNSITKDLYITVLPAQSTLTPNVFETFENGDPTVFTGTKKFTHSSPTTTRFSLYTQSAFAGTTCLRAPIVTNSGAGSVYSITLPSVDATVGSGLRFTFMVSYAQPNADVTEILRIFASTDCGGTFKQVWERSGTGLAYTGQSYTSNFKPNNANQWRVAGLTSLSSLGLNSFKNVIFRIDVVSAGGNPVYIDNINISNFNASTADFNSFNTDVLIHPNPVNESSELTLTVPANAIANIDIYDAQGKVVFTLPSEQLIAGENSIKLAPYTHLPSGVYFARISINGNLFNKPFVISQ